MTDKPRLVGAALLAGLLFGGGLQLGGMTNPDRVRSFLDMFGKWDPTLAFVMLGAVIVTAIAWVVRRSMDRPTIAAQFDLPTPSKIDHSLVIGSLMFGIGWGIAGLCPGPALAVLALRPLAVLPFILAMAGGMLLHRQFFGHRSQSLRSGKHER